MDYSMLFAAVGFAALALTAKLAWRFGLWLRARKDKTINH